MSERLPRDARMIFGQSHVSCCSSNKRIHAGIVSWKNITKREERQRQASLNSPNDLLGNRMDDALSKDRDVSFVSACSTTD